MTETSFLEFIGHICKRPAMYSGGSVSETVAFIDGYRFGNSTPISGRLFDRYVCIRNLFPDNYAWSYVIRTCSKNDLEAFEMIERTITEFIELNERLSDDELIQYASEQLPEESQVEKIFRQFDTALLSGNEIIIRQLIEEHNDAEILWKAAYPDDVAIQLNEISRNNRVKSIPISEDGTRMKIIAQGWPFPIEMNFVSGEWKIDASEIIAMRMNNALTGF